MKMWKKFLTSAVAFAMLFTLLAGNVCAAESYTYKATVYAGNHGTMKNIGYVSVFRMIDGVSTQIQLPVSVSDDKIVIPNLQYNDQLAFTAQSSVAVDGDSKYYVQGTRLSGRDNELAEEDAKYIIQGDVDYVVAYGIEGDQVSYTVKYVDESGKSLAADDVFYGNVGDKPVVAYKFIDGYAPKALGLTKTLSATEAENVFTFVYVKAPSNTYKEVYVTGEGGTSYVENIVVVPGGTAATGGATGGATNVTGGGAGAGEDDANAPDGAGDEAAGGEGGSDVIVDLDDEETPLANIDADGDSKMALPLAGYVAMGAAGLAALIAIIILILKNKAKKETNNE